MRKNHYQKVSKIEKCSRFVNSIDQYVNYHFNQKQYWVIVLISSEMLRMCPEMRKNGKRNYTQIQGIAPKHIKISESEKMYPLIVHPDIISYNFVTYCMQISLTLRKLKGKVH